MKINKNTILYLVIALILAGAIITQGVLNFISKQNEINADTASRTKEYLKQGELDKCLADAKTEYDRVFNLNSVEGTTPGGEKARKWNSVEVEQTTQANYDKDREFCLKIYK